MVWLFFHPIFNSMFECSCIKGVEKLDWVKRTKEYFKISQNTYKGIKFLTEIVASFATTGYETTISLCLIAANGLRSFFNTLTIFHWFSYAEFQRLPRRSCTTFPHYRFARLQMATFMSMRALRSTQRSALNCTWKRSSCGNQSIRRLIGSSWVDALQNDWGKLLTQVSRFVLWRFK